MTDAADATDAKAAVTDVRADATTDAADAVSADVTKDALPRDAVAAVVPPLTQEAHRAHRERQLRAHLR